MQSQFVDTYNRKFYYLRLSVTDVCNFRCRYCLPDGYKRLSRDHFLSVDEIRRLIRAFSQAGCQKIRVTGGEPTLRSDFIDIISAIRQDARVKIVALTTNGYRMARDVKRWYDAGLTSINVSVDSLDVHQFYQITGQNKLKQIISGIDAAFDAGFKQIKVNAVLMRNINSASLPLFLAWIKDKPIQLRFIELMEIGKSKEFFRKYHLSGNEIKQQLIATGWCLKPKTLTDGPAQVFTHADYRGEIGLVMPYEQGFCSSCNRLRVSAQGKLHLCLFGERHINLRDLLVNDGQINELQQRIRSSLTLKRETHFLHQSNSGMTQNLSIIGG